MSYKLHIEADAVNVAHAVADLIKEKAIEKREEGKKLNIAISGGSTPKQLFTLLGNEYEREIPWKTVRFFWVDERCVEPTDPESNFGMTYDALLQRTFVPNKNIFRMKGEDIPENEAERYQQLLWNEVPAKHGFPVFDIILLGIGEDGHTASIFPNQMTLLDSEFSVAVAVHPVSSQKRITLTGNTIKNAHRIVFLATGAAKADILRKIIHKETEAAKYPAAHVYDQEGNVDFYIDKAASSKL
ncbi:MAG: 6-phosphogluconolactonase [Paludibacter sp.]|nr:6-phosphogluconolactonase [Paludibacter sp.]